MLNKMKSRPIVTIILALVGALVIFLIGCFGLSYWWFEVAAYDWLKPYPGAVRINETRSHYSDSGTPSFNYILIQQYEIAGPSLEQIVEYYKGSMAKDDWSFNFSGPVCGIRCGDRGCCGPDCNGQGDDQGCDSGTATSLYMLSWAGRGEDLFSDVACIEIEPLTSRSGSWQITHWTHHKRIF
jgi:hypothetical protein